MSVFSRLEVSNFLNVDNVPSGTGDWQPHWRHVVLNFNCSNTAVRIDNGEGKSTLNRAIYALLSRKSNLVSATREKCAARRNGTFSHVRLEVVHESRSRQRKGTDPRSAEVYVFGLVGYSDDRLDFYHYKGTLEDCPVVLVDGTHKQFVPNEQFLERLNQLNPICPIGKPLDVWRDHVGVHIDTPTLHQAIEYQAKGGGDSSEAIFKVPRAAGETYDSAFFYEHLAPEVLVGCMENFGKKDERRFEDTLYESSMAVVGAEEKHQANKAETQELTAIFQILLRAKEHADTHAETVAERRRLASQYLAEMKLLREFVELQPLPGVPVEDRSSGTQTASISNSLVLNEGRWVLPDAVLSRLLATEPGRLNQQADREGVASVRLGAQTIDIPCDLSRKEGWAPKGHPNRAYSLDGVVHFIQTGSSLADGWDRDSLLRAVNYAFAWRQGEGDPNPPRRAGRAANLESTKLDHSIAQWTQRRSQVEVEHQQATQWVQRIEAAEQHLLAMQTSGFFTSDDLLAPLEAEARITQARGDVRQFLEQHRRHKLELAAGRAAFESCAAGFPGVEPGQQLDIFKRSQSELREQARAAEQVLNRLRTEVAEALAASNAAQTQLRELRDTHAALTALLPKVRQFEAFFGDEPAQGLAERVAQELRDATSRQRALQEEQGRLRTEQEKLRGFVEPYAAFVALFGEVAPEGLAATVVKARQDAVHALETGQREHSAARERVALLQAGQAALQSVRDRCGAQADVATLEARLREQELVALRRRAELAALLERHQPLLEALVGFRDAFGPEAVPAAVREQRAEDLRRLHLEIEAARTSSSGLQAELEELNSAGTAAGRFAREALATLTHDTARLYQAIDGFGLDAARREQLLCHFSQVLHAPVVDTPEEAADAVGRLHAAGIEFPVFMHEALERFCCEGVLHADATGQVTGLLAGLPTLQVRILIDPAQIELRKGQLRAQIQTLGEAIRDSQAKAAELGPQSRLGLLIESAVAAVELGSARLVPEAHAEDRALAQQLEELGELLADAFVAQIRRAVAFLSEGSEALATAERRLAELESHIARLEESLPELERRSSPAALDLITRATQFRNLGGSDRLAELAERLETIAIELDALAGDLPRLRERDQRRGQIEARAEYDSLGGHDRNRTIAEAIAQAQAAAETAAQAHQAIAGSVVVAEGVLKEAQQRLSECDVELARWHGPLTAALEYIAQDGPAFDASYAAKEKDWTDQDLRHERALRFDFKLADQGAKARLDPSSEATYRGRLGELGDERIRLNTAIDQGQRRLLELARQVAELEAQARELDRHAEILVRVWRLAREVIVQLKPEEVAGASPNESPLVRACRALAEELRQAVFSREPKDLVAQVGDIAGNVERFSLNADKKQFLELKSQEARQLRSVRTEAETLARDGSRKLSDEERSGLGPDVEPDKLLGHVRTLHGLFEEHLLKAERTLEATEKDLAGTKQRFHESMQGFTHTIGRNFDVLRKTLAPTEPGAAGLSVDATLLGDDAIRAKIDEIVELIRNELKARQLRAQQYQVSGREDDQKGPLRQAIRRLFYRGIFSNPVVKLVHPQIAGGRPERLTQDVSTGQLNAVGLMILFKMADYAQARDEQLDSSFVGGRARRARSSRVVMIDGLFSNLSSPKLIRPSLEAIRQIKGQFQLIGWIHYPQYENDPTFFPSFVALRRAGNGVLVKRREVYNGEMVSAEMHVQPAPPPHTNGSGGDATHA